MCHLHSSVEEEEAREQQGRGQTFSRPLFLFRIKGAEREICISSEDEGAASIVARWL